MHFWSILLAFNFRHCSNIIQIFFSIVLIEKNDLSRVIIPPSLNDDGKKK